MEHAEPLLTCPDMKGFISKPRGDSEAVAPNDVAEVLASAQCEIAAFCTQSPLRALEGSKPLLVAPQKETIHGHI